MNFVKACEESQRTRERQEYRKSKVFLVKPPWNLIDNDRAGIYAIKINRPLDHYEQEETDQCKCETLYLNHRIDPLHPPKQFLIQLNAYKQYKCNKSTKDT
jgi:hypothetical protein